MKMIKALLTLGCLLLVSSAMAADNRLTLFENVRIFDGSGTSITDPRHVLVRDNLIDTISSEPIQIDPADTVMRIDGAGRTLMPGLIDTHTHLAMGTISQVRLMTGDNNYATLLSGQAAGEMLMRGFTSVRDAGGPVFGLKAAIDEGRIPGPRIWPSGALISQTSGHGDFRMLGELPRSDGEMHMSERFGYAAIVDGEPLMLRRVREQLMRGATQVKLMGGGGVTSLYDPLDVNQFTEREIRAAVEAAEDWGTYVMIHAYTPQSVQRALRAGVKSIEHGQLADEETIKMMAEHDAWLSIQPFLGDPDPRLPEGSPRRLKQLQVAEGTDRAIRLAKEHGVRIAWSLDILFNPAKAEAQGRELVRMTRWFEPEEVLQMATSTNAELLALSGLRNPYPGKLGVVEEGALADLLLVDGDPVENLDLIAEPHKSFLIIMKDGRIFKNIL
ncbi:metal-dependent hydrolase family protein [Nitrincola alkalilacustris]|uniref:metal-dependent hydrolase family protein n=1 Tax=Nitrincola alkalilacustris TaxID=1571224 RepID=UPI00124D0E98|nr:amidohydrolase family protein [Nitrincola alkalilacustris]